MGGRPIYTVGPGVPQVGTLAFGVVDRGTNVLEVRPTSVCALSCVFCSVNAGPQSRARWAEYVVEVEALLSALEEVVRFKKTDDVEVHIDGMGDPGAHPQLVELVEGAKAIRGVAVVSMQTRLYMLNEGRIRRLAVAGLDRFNVSIDALDPALARKRAGAGWYDVERVLQLVKTALEAGINVVISPVWVPGLNDEEMPKIAKWAVENGVGKGVYTPVLIQKYIPHKRGRRVNMQPMSWGEFWSRLKRRRSSESPSYRGRANTTSTRRRSSRGPTGWGRTWRSRSWRGASSKGRCWVSPCREGHGDLGQDNHRGLRQGGV